MSAGLRNVTTVDEALQALAEDPQSRLLAGGTDLVVGARQGKRPLPESLVGLQRIEALQEITVDADGLRLGALVSHARILEHPAVLERWPALADGSALVGSPATRANGSIGGNVMNASPAMDTGGPLLVHDASVELRSTRGVRRVAVADLWTAPGRTVAERDELLTSIHVPAAPDGTGAAYVRLEYRRAMEIAVVGASAFVALDGDGSVREARIALTALAPTIRRVAAAEERLAGATPERAAIEAAARAAAEAAQPIGDVRAGAEYRRAMAAVIARRAIEAALRRARGERQAIPASAAFGGNQDGGSL
jgi:CO/xanthine dehydrogenase FAD-binding subunit